MPLAEARVPLPLWPHREGRAPSRPQGGARRPAEPVAAAPGGPRSVAAVVNPLHPCTRSFNFQNPCLFWARECAIITTNDTP